VFFHEFSYANMGRLKVKQKEMVEIVNRGSTCISSMCDTYCTQKLTLNLRLENNNKWEFLLQ
jgi:hypothetical protein